MKWPEYINLERSEIMKSGFDIFGKAYGFMFRNDLHDENSVDYNFIRKMILLDSDSEEYLYDPSKYIINKNIAYHDLYGFAQQFKGTSCLESMRNILAYTRNIIVNFNLPFEDMMFGGTEKEIIERGTDWCTDISRVGCALLQCLNIPCRMITLVNTKQAYNGHTVCEVLVEKQFIMCDFTYGVFGLLDKGYSVKSLLRDRDAVEKIYSDIINLENNRGYILGLYDKAAFNEYDLTKIHNYNISKPNEYYLSMMKLNHDGTWKLGENTYKKSNSV